MMLPRLNENGPQHSEARGINPPIVRAMMHIGYAVAIANITPEEDWADTHRLATCDEIREALGHLRASNAQGFDPSPFISEQAIRQLNQLADQFELVIDNISDPEAQKEDIFAQLTVLADNAAYISAVAENYVIGNGADEGRNP
jgi:hypothetical protein